MAPRKLTLSLQRLPPILHKTGLRPISAYSKGSRGLSVLLRVRGIFTTTTISPGRWLRQCNSHYAFHAGRNLPDKELRYLRTLKVRAAVYWGFGRELLLRLPTSLTYQHRAGVRRYTSTCVFARSCVFDKQLLLPIYCGPQPLFKVKGAPYRELTGPFCRVP